MLVGTVCGHTKLGVECSFCSSFFWQAEREVKFVFLVEQQDGQAAGPQARATSSESCLVAVTALEASYMGEGTRGARGRVGVWLRVRGGVGHGRGEFHQHPCLVLLRGVRGGLVCKGGCLGWGRAVYLVGRMTCF